MASCAAATETDLLSLPTEVLHMVALQTPSVISVCRFLGCCKTLRSLLLEDIQIQALLERRIGQRRAASDAMVKIVLDSPIGTAAAQIAEQFAECLAMPDADINTLAASGASVLHLACSLRGHPSHIQAILAIPNINVNITHPHSGQSPLHWAVRACKLTHVEALLDHPLVLVSLKDSQGFTPTDLALNDRRNYGLSGAQMALSLIGSQLKKVFGNS